MARLILLDQLHVHVLVPAGLPERQAARMARAVGSARFRRALARTVRVVCQQHPQLGKARIQVSG
jgi:hypothetical protein